MTAETLIQDYIQGFQSFVGLWRLVRDGRVGIADPESHNHQKMQIFNCHSFHMTEMEF